MDLHLELNINKKDVLIIVLLSTVFFSVAVANLGSTQFFKTTTLLSDGQSFYVDLGSQVNVKSVIVVVAKSAFNYTIYTGSPGNWVFASANVGPYDDYQGWYGSVYYLWSETNVGTATQYLRLDFGPTGNLTQELAEIGVINTDNQTVNIQSIHNSGSGNPDLQRLTDEQNLVHYYLDYSSVTYFDEGLFVQSAQDYLQHQVPFEQTHPPLGKLIMAGGITVFGFDPFGWRIMGVVFGTLMIPLIYLLGKKLFNSWVGGFSAAFLLTFDFMHFTMARMATVDTFTVFFSLASQLFYFIYLKNVLNNGWKTSATPLILSIVLFALGFSTKWLVLFGFAGEIAILILLRINDARKTKKLAPNNVPLLPRSPKLVFAALLAAVAIYFLTYIPDLLVGRSFLDVINLQGSMFQYHAFLPAFDPSASPWFTWPLMFNPSNMAESVPIILLSGSLPNGGISCIVLMGNPLVWWVGLAAMIGLIVVFAPKLFLKKFSRGVDLVPLSIVAVFLFQWLAYIFITRSVYIYHFYSCVPFLCLASAFFISKYWKNKNVKILTIIYFALVIAVFILFYSAISGAPTSQSALNNLEWIPSWPFY